MIPVYNMTLIMAALAGLSVTAMASASPAGEPVKGNEPGPHTVDRVAGFHHTIVTTNNTRPNSCLMTYMNETGNPSHQHLLAKIVPGVEVDGKVLWTSGAANVDVRDIPGGVVATYTVGGVKVTAEIVPLMQGRGTGRWEGAALYTISTRPARTVVLRIGGGRDAFMHFNPVEWVVTDEVEFEGASAQVNGDTALLRSSKHPLAVGIKASGEVTKETAESGADYLVVRIGEGTGNLLLSFAKEDARALEMTKLDPEAERQRVTAYYDKLLSSSRVETPEKAINDAFRTALYNLEYNWVEPIGWVESLHHWTAMWHQQHTPGAEWLGQADRSRQCIVTHAQKALPGGAIPHMSPGGQTRRDFGGSNQFYLWQVRHYLNFTDDRDTVQKIAPAVERAVEQSFEEYDPEGDGLLCWGLQIGNQEDFSLTPFNGTSPTVEGINMLRTAAMVARVAGEEEKTASYERRVARSAAKLRSQLWMKDLGRFAFYKDPTEQLALDGQYQTYIYPVIWDILDPLDSWTSMRHLRDRLMGTNGEVYVSNNFPDHLTDMWATWGMQAGAAQQPWGAWGLAKLGLRNETYRPLKALADWVMGDFHKGSWPEVAHEMRLGYFSPPAGLYVQSVVEAVFGLGLDRHEKVLTVAPSFPDEWPSAKLTLPEFKAEYNRKGNTVDYIVESREPLARRVRWMLPVGAVNEVIIDGQQVKFEVKPGVGYVTLHVDVPESKRTRFTIRFNPLKLSLSAPGSIAEGDILVLKLSGAEIERVDDRCGVLEGWRMISNNGMKARVRTCQLTPYLPYGRLGQMNFSRRTFFLECSAKSVRFWLPVDVTILPRYEAASKGEMTGGKAQLLVRNNTLDPLAGTAQLVMHGEYMPFDVDLQARSEEAYAVGLTRSVLSSLSTGGNAAEVILPGGTTLDVAFTAQEQAVKQVVQLSLPESELTSVDEWGSVRGQYSGRCIWEWPKPPMEGLVGKSELAVTELPGVSFKLSDKGLVVLSRKLDRPEFKLDLGGRSYRKLYLLVAGLMDNHNTFLSVARIGLNLGKGQCITRIIHFPGDMDWWSGEIGGRLATFKAPRADRLGLLPMLDEKTADWPNARPPSFPQPELWSKSLAVKTLSAVMNVIELDMGSPIELQSLDISMISADPALGLVAVTASVE